MADETLNSIGIVVNDTPDEHGGIIREITGVNLAEDTVSPGSLRKGVTAHDATGQLIVGTGPDIGRIGTISGELSPTRNITGALSVPQTYITPYELPPATTETLGGIIVGDDLKITEEGRLSVDKTDSFSADNTKPVTASAVYTQIGNINALLETI